MYETGITKPKKVDSHSSMLHQNIINICSFQKSSNPEIINQRSYQCYLFLEITKAKKVVSIDLVWINFSTKIRRYNELNFTHKLKSTYAFNFYKSSFHLSSPKAKVYKLIF